MYILERGMECLPQVLSYLDDEFCQSLKDLHSLPAPPVKADFSKGDQLSFVSDMLLEDHDMQLNWNCALFRSDDDDDDDGGGGGHPDSPIMESGEDGLWRCLPSDKSLEEMLSDMDTSIFEGLVGSPLDCHNLMESQETGEATSDYCSNGGDVSAYTSSDSEEEIDVVTVGRCPSRQQQEEEERQRRALQRRLHFDIQLQHNYAAPPPASPPPPSSNRHSRRHYEHHSAETEDEEERRRTHNVMERQRRNELKNCFVRLRDNVPELSRNDKASKVVILKKARDCIHGLENNNYRLQAKRDKLRAKQEELKARLRHLRSPVRS
ncbi:myc proto-oncogene protein-like [Hippocampus comes]|uniref:myc proto-oncogene protein-like n=1 Tax=Hippocampus comes TaxID=109280 RepID=UPI00094E5143|nr:PREDICTED: myc proto-oncogene protein-like [Hippocampus comes]